ncbi:recombinase family protein [Streptococcus mitis]|nr:recombinase family protein [Streptococcus mitis]
MTNSTLTRQIPDWTEVKFEDLTDISVLYCRLSQDDGNLGDSNSIINQKMVLKNAAQAEHLPNPIYFIDDGISGVTLNRPAIQKALELVESGKVRNFVAKDLSRIARNYLFSGQLLEMTFPENNVRCIAVNDSYDSLKQSDNDANLLPLRNLFNEWFARDTSKKIRAVQKAKAQAGERLTTVAIYGYRKNPDNPKEWLIDPVGAEIVKRIFEEVKLGKSLKQIARGLEHDKVETPSYRRLSVGDKTNVISYSRYAWQVATIEKILQRPEYLGHTVNHRTSKISFKDKRKIYNPKENWLIFENTHEAIIDQVTFDIVQKMRQHKRILSKPRFEKGHENLFAGLVFCGTCGSKHYFCAHDKNGRNLDHYKCSKYAKTFDRCENPHYIRKVELEALVLRELNDLIEEIQIDETGFFKSLQKRFEIESSRKTAQQRKVVLEKEKRCEEIDQLIQKLYEDNVLGKVSDERFMKMTQNYEAEQNELNQVLSNLKSELSKNEADSQNIEQFIKRIRKFTHIDKLTTEILNVMIDKIVIHKPEGTKRNRIIKIDIHYNFIGNVNKENE